MDSASLIAKLSQRIGDGKRLPRPQVAPALSYGRHRGPAKRNARVAAVAVTMFQDEDGQWMIPLTLRPTSLQHHGGQICLPGGRVEADEDPFTAAMREFEEELGVPAQVCQHCGTLDTQYVYASNNLVHPVVAVLDRPTAPWQPDPVEVAEVIEFPLANLLNQQDWAKIELNRDVRQQETSVGVLNFRATAFQHGTHRVWGATALILDQLARILL